METSNNTYKHLKVEEVIQVRNDFKLYVFSSAEEISYAAGQYLTLVMHDHEKEVRRSYSLTSSPELNERLTIGVKRVANGFFSRKLIDYVKTGDHILTTGAGGLFVLPEETTPYKQVYFFAAGAGITPCFSMIKTILAAHKHLSVVLIYSNTSAETTIFKDELTQLREENPERFKIEFLYSNSRNLSKARLHPSLLLEYISSFSSQDYHQTLYYICGPLVYMDMCTFTLQGSGVPKINIRKENFILEGSPSNKILPPDKESRIVKLLFNNNRYSLQVNYPESILQSAKRQGISLPYSCEAGRCGNCVAKCTSGNIWMSYNEVLTDKELDQGLVLTCVGHPVGGDAEIIF